jgi:hypothetical protein
LTPRRRKLASQSSFWAMRRARSKRVNSSIEAVEISVSLISVILHPQSPSKASNHYFTEPYYVSWHFWNVCRHEYVTSAEFWHFKLSGFYVLGPFAFLK